MFCKYCGNKIDEDSKFCSCCGKSLSNNQSFGVTYSKINCKKCGSLLLLEEDDNIVKCPYCDNENIINNDKNKIEPINNDKQEEQEPEEKNENPALIGFKVLFIFIAVIFCLFTISVVLNDIASSDLFSSCNETNVLERDIVSSDYDLVKSQGLTYYKLMITPNTNIKELTIELKLYNGSDQLIYSDTITKKNLNKNSTYTYQFNYGFSVSLSGSYVKYNITGEK